MVTCDTIEQKAQQEGFEPLDAMLLPLEHAVKSLPQWRVDATDEYHLLHGQKVDLAENTTNWTEGQCIRLISSETNRFLGVGEYTEDGKIAPRRLLRTEF
jgi:tRNA pseudouridine55 synthase